MSNAEPTQDQDSAPLGRADEHEFSEERESLWRITLAPAIWAFHFVISYAAVSVYCFRLNAIFDMASLRLGIGAMTLAALAAIAWLGWRSFRRWDVWGTGEFSNPVGNAEDRHQFLGHAGFLLALISFIGVAYDALPVLILTSCR